MRYTQLPKLQIDIEHPVARFLWERDRSMHLIGHTDTSYSTWSRKWKGRGKQEDSEILGRTGALPAGLFSVFLTEASETNKQQLEQMDHYIYI